MKTIFSLAKRIQHSLLPNKPSQFLGCAVLLAITTLSTGCAESPPPSEVIALKRCDLNLATCTLPSAWGELALTLSPQPIPVMKAVQVELAFKSGAEAIAGIDAQLELTGSEMDMGPNKIKLKASAANKLSGTLYIPICITGTMRWQLKLNLNSPGKQQHFVLEFIAPLEATKHQATSVLN